MQNGPAKAGNWGIFVIFNFLLGSKMKQITNITKNNKFITNYREIKENNAKNREF